jgi:hypothetical protein
VGAETIGEKCRKRVAGFNRSISRTRQPVRPKQQHESPKQINSLNLIDKK